MEVKIEYFASVLVDHRCWLWCCCVSTDSIFVDLRWIRPRFPFEEGSHNHTIEPLIQSILHFPPLSSVRDPSPVFFGSPHQRLVGHHLNHYRRLLHRFALIFWSCVQLEELQEKKSYATCLSHVIWSSELKVENSCK